MLAQTLLLAALARLRATMVEPPRAKIRERPRQVLRSRRKAVAGPVHEVAMSASLDLEFIGEGLRLGLGGSLGGLATSFAGRVGPLRVPDVTALQDTCHELRASVALTYHRTRARH